MRRDFLATLGVVLLAGAVWADMLPEPASGLLRSPGLYAAAPPGSGGDSPRELPPLIDKTPEGWRPSAREKTAGRPRYWAGADYLLWWSKRGPLAVPLVTTSSVPGHPFAGAIDQAETTVLFGGDGLAFGGQSGVSYVLGSWLGDDELLGLEMRGFLLAQQNVGFHATSGTIGLPPLYLPWIDANDRTRHGTLIISDPIVGFSGRITAAATTRLWGLESNALSNLLSRERLNVVVLAGLRYLDLQERLQLTAVTSDMLIDDHIAVQDQFSAMNRFFGGQIGARAEYRTGIFTADLTSKFALGAAREVLTVVGASQETGLGALNPGSHLGGVFAQPTNMGRQTNTSFAFVPQLGVNVGFNPLQAVQFKVGYDFLYWSNVARPGDQIDRVINPTQVLGQQLTGPGRPLPQFNRTDFWAHGFNFGVFVNF